MQKVLCLTCLVLIVQVSSMTVSPTKMVKQPTKELSYDSVPEPEYMMFEGDIRMPVDFDPEKLSEELSRDGEPGYRTKRNAVADRGFLWPDGVVPYIISNKFNKTSKKLFKESMKMIEDHTMVKGKKCIKFIPRTDEDNYINLEMLRNCWSELGRLGIGRQNVSLGRQCFSHGTVMHELIHALGFYHEQSRADRDYYIDVLWDNVKKGAENNFKKFALGTSIDHLDQPYDYDSVMHYGTDSFAQDPSKPTITTKIKLTNGVHIGQRDHLSVIDIKMIQKLYSCDKDAFTGRDPYGPCFDKLENCNLYGQHACNQLPKWAEENCAATCGICTPDCSDKRTDCKDYNKDQICFGDWKDWGEENCAKFCGLGDCQYITSPKPAASCVDKIDDCADYQGDFCNEYPTWSAEKCPRYCNLCPAEVPTTPTVPPCQDQMDCSHFPISICKISSMKTNCARHCNMCPDQNLAARTTKALPTTTKPPPTTTPTPTTTDPDCFDADSDCVDYSKSVCKNYYDWAKAHCKKYCGLCGDVRPPPTTRQTTRKTTTKRTTTPATTTPFQPTSEGECKDQLSDCDDYDSNVCTEYLDWSRTNCRKFCGFCKGETTTTTTTTTTHSSNCYNKLSDCAEYSSDVCENYPDWSRTNCESFCGLCGKPRVTTMRTTEATTTKPTTLPTTTTTTPKPETTTEGECNDDLSDCDAYGDDVCTNYPDWAKINCRMFCKFCKPKSAPTTTTTTTTQSSICQDALSDCPDYTRSMCSTNPDWAKLNCANFCGFCGTQRDQCVDKRDDCYDFGEDQCGGIYSTYMKEQCANFCGYC